MGRSMGRAGVMVYVNGVVAALLAIYFLLIPGMLVTRNLCDPAWGDGGIPREAWRVHRSLGPRYARWARERVASGDAARVHYQNVPGTEWPIFGSVFYLWATEHLQAAWEADPSLSREAPAVYARGTIEACKDLILDRNHHAFVRRHWGDDYMHQENAFFRSLVIAGSTSYEKLTGTGEYLPLLRDQLDTLSAELDASRFGVLYGYPGECYPIDVFAAVAWIQRGDAVAGTDHSAFFARERRAFEGDRLDDHGMIPWVVDPQTGYQFEGTRGIINSHVLIFAPDLYPDLAQAWYERFEEHFWQERWWAAGFREFYRDRPGSDWTYDVDAGPVLDGFSPAANGFGVAAARRNGRLDHGYTIGAMMLTAAWPLADGRLLGGRMLSDPVHAPYLGEAAILWQLTETPAEGVELVRGGRLVGSVYIGLAFFFGGGLLILLLAAWRVRRFRRRRGGGVCRLMGVQFVVWAGLVVAGVGLIAWGSVLLMLFVLFVAQLLPRGWKRDAAIGRDAACVGVA